MRNNVTEDLNAAFEWSKEKNDTKQTERGSHVKRKLFLEKKSCALLKAGAD